MTVATGKKASLYRFPCITHHTCLIQPLKMYRITAHAGLLPPGKKPALLSSGIIRTASVYISGRIDASPLSY
jgi:hypothetical protein